MWVHTLVNVEGRFFGGSFLIASIFSVKGKNMSSTESEDRGESVEVWGVRRCEILV